MLGILLLMFQKKKQLSPADIKKFNLYLTKLSNTASAQQQIVECDKLYHQILKAYGYRGTFGEILKQKPRIISDIQSIWNLHKLRNTLVHELNDFPETLLQKKSKNYQKEISRLLRG